MTRSARRRMERAWSALAAHTYRACASCPGWEGEGPHGCYSRVHCESTLTYAREGFGLDLPQTEHQDLPLMGPEGCTAAPYLRSWCSAWSCAARDPRRVPPPEPGGEAWLARARALTDAAYDATPPRLRDISGELISRGLRECLGDELVDLALALARARGGADWHRWQDGAR